MSVVAPPMSAPMSASPDATQPANPLSGFIKQTLADPAFNKLPPEMQKAYLSSKMGGITSAAQAAPGQPPAPAPVDMTAHADQQFAASLAQPRDRGKAFGLDKLAQAPDASTPPMATSAPVPRTEEHPLVATLANPNADHAQALEKYVFG